MSKVLIVEDEDDIRNSLRRRLEREGYDVFVAASAAEADVKIQAQHPSFDVVISDMSMEAQDSGLVVLKDAIAHDVFTEVIVITAYGNVANAVESMRRGAFDYVEKNVPGIDVYELIVYKVGLAMERRRTAVDTVRRLEEVAVKVDKPASDAK